MVQSTTEQAAAPIGHPRSERAARSRQSHSYFVVMRRMSRGYEAVVDPEITRREVVSRIVSGEYKDIDFIHFVDGLFVEDLTRELIVEAEQYLQFKDPEETRIDRITALQDHLRDLRKHSEAAE